jgi:hypothetical protein
MGGICGDLVSGLLDAFETWREMASPLTAEEVSLAHGFEGASLELEGTSFSLLESVLPDFFLKVSFIL